MKRTALATSTLALLVSASAPMAEAANPLVAQAARHQIGHEIARECWTSRPIGHICMLGYVRTRTHPRVANMRIVLARHEAANSTIERRAWATVLRSQAAKWLTEVATVGRLRPPVLHWVDNGRTLIYDRDLVPK